MLAVRILGLILILGSIWPWIEGEAQLFALAQKASREVWPHLRALLTYYGAMTVHVIGLRMFFPGNLAFLGAIFEIALVGGVIIKVAHINGVLERLQHVPRLEAAGYFAVLVVAFFAISWAGAGFQKLLLGGN